MKKIPDFISSVSGFHSWLKGHGLFRAYAGDEGEDEPEDIRITALAGYSNPDPDFIAGYHSPHHNPPPADYKAKVEFSVRYVSFDRILLIFPKVEFPVRDGLLDSFYVDIPRAGVVSNRCSFVHMLTYVIEGHVWGHWYGQPIVFAGDQVSYYVATPVETVTNY